MSNFDLLKENFSEKLPEKNKPKSIMWKVFTIIGLTLLLLIPLGMIGGVIGERQVNQDKVELDISQTWGGEQSLLGPVLAIPYKTVISQDAQGQKKVEIRNVAYLLPQQYQVDAKIAPEVRDRGIYQSIVYRSGLKAQGTFSLKALQQLNIASERFLWQQAYVCIGIPSTNGIEKRPDLTWQNKPLEMLPGIGDASFLGTGLYAPVTLDPTQDNMPFRLNIALRGSKSLMLAPLGKQNTLTMDSSWTSPSFVGSLLPTTRAVSKQGFNARWDIPYFARNYNQAFIDTIHIPQQLTASTVGVQLLTPVDSYRQTDRAIKYGLLFLVLTFSTYFLFEIIGKHRFHPFQYLLIGLAISLFYLLLLALSEVIQFMGAYVAASVGIIVSITLYSKAILRSAGKFPPLLIGSLLTVLYTYLYVLLQLEDLSLLFGALGLFVVLSLIMYLTRHIDWYSEQTA